MNIDTKKSSGQTTRQKVQATLVYFLLHFDMALKPFYPCSSPDLFCFKDIK